MAEKTQEIPGFDIRYTNLNDAPFLREWLSAPGMLHWFPMSDEKETEDAIQCWIGFCRWSCSLTATIDDVPCGIATLFLMPYRKVAHHCLFKMIVDPKHQRKGVGSALMKNLKHLAKTYFRLEMMHTEIFEGNPMVHLLQKFDFYKFAEQGHYVNEEGKFYGRMLFQADL